LCNTHKEVVPARIDYIDAWRFLAVVMVIQSHIFVYSGLKVPLLTPYLDHLDRLGELGVLVFFCDQRFCDLFRPGRGERPDGYDLLTRILCAPVLSDYSAALVVSILSFAA